MPSIEILQEERIADTVVQVVEEDFYGYTVYWVQTRNLDAQIDVVKACDSVDAAWDAADALCRELGAVDYPERRSAP